jgi:DNA-nicking Smr family endonuclease
MGDKDGISDAERKLFRDTVGAVRPVRNDRVTRTPRPPQRRKKIQRDIQDQSQAVIPPFSDQFLAAAAEEPIAAADTLFYARSGLQRKTLRRLKRGQLRNEAVLDMHGLTVDEARQCLAEFIDDCRRQRLRSVLIIHGKGYRSSAARPVLKSMVNNWLRQHDGVVAFCSARPGDGGTGALYVLLKLG